VIVLDSSFLVAFHNSRDAHHVSAAETMQRLVGGEWGPALLLEYVYLEVVTVIAARRSPAIAIGVGETLLRAREVEFVPCSEHFPVAVETFGRFAEIGLSFVDAAIVAVARARGAEVVATFDADFATVGDLTVVPG
jgi:predicted nucleic acid-binding protein